ncbi:GGDEF domain-containing protein [Candidatus Kaiserbacteria bacterium]|nr:GGDEF domain-containing protein [Candidatus Kaiserbacteria bacterium]
MDIEKASRRAMEKNDEKRHGISEEEKEDHTDERTAYTTKYRKDLEAQIVTDELTGAASLLGFTNRLEQFMGLARREKIPASLVYLDIDYFKKVNDTFGHPGGDAVLKEVCAFLMRSVREVDVVARIGGEEIAILLEGTRAEQAREKVEKLREEIQTLAFKNYPDLKVTASFGIAPLNGAETPEDIRAHADKALYAAKHGGRNRVEVYSGT